MLKCMFIRYVFGRWSFSIWKRFYKQFTLCYWSRLTLFSSEVRRLEPLCVKVIVEFPGFQSSIASHLVYDLDVYMWCYHQRLFRCTFVWIWFWASSPLSISQLYLIRLVCLFFHVHVYHTRVTRFAKNDGNHV